MATLYTNPTVMKKITFVLIALILFGCTQERTQRPSATGRAGELVVVMENHYFQDLAGTALRDVFQANVPMELINEPFYDIIQIPSASFTRLYEVHRHILMVEINPNLQSATVERSEDLWSSPQLVLRIKAPSQQSFAELMEQRGASLVQQYIDMEFRRYISAYNSMLNPQANKVVEEMFGFTLAIPDGYFVAKQGDNFVWLRQTGIRTDKELGILIATFDYNDANADFSPQAIRERRDEITKRYIHGVTEGSFMTTYSPQEFPRVKFHVAEVDFNGMYAVKVNSLWKMDGEFLGGPFVNFTLVDPNTNKLLMLDGWVFYPNKGKRDFMRQVEALIRSINFKPQA